MDRQAEVQRLSLANRHIVNAERNVTGQTFELERLRRGGHDTAMAERTLENFKGLLQALCNRRKLIIKTIEQIDRGLI